MPEINQLNQAISLYREGLLDQSSAIFKQLINKNFQGEACYYYLGLIEVAKANFLAAIEHLDKAIAINPKKPEYIFNKAIALGHLGKYEECLNLLEIVEKLLPNALIVLFNKAVTLGKLGRKDSELQIYKKILGADPSNQDALNNIAVCCNELNQSEQALNYINFLLSMNANHASALKTKSDILQKMGHLSESHECLKKYLTNTHKDKLISLEIFNFCEQIIKLIKIPSNYNHIDEINAARQSVEEALQTAASLINQVNLITDQEFEIIIAILLRVNLFYLAYQQKDDRKINEWVCLLISKILEHRVSEFTQKTNKKSSKIKLGVLSRFKYHVDTDILAWIEQLPANDYEFIFIRLNSEPTNNYLEKLKKLGGVIDIQLDESNLRNVVSQIRELDLNALFMQDIGMTSDGKFLANIRFTPLQFTNWSHPVTSGSQVIDYYLSSDLMEPSNAQEHYTEKLIRLPNLGLFTPTYQVLEGSGKKELDPNYFNIGCLQSLFKYLPQDDDVFIEICKRIPNAKLIFIEDVTKVSTNFFTNRLKTTFKENGISFENHVSILARRPHDQFMSLMNETDIELDSIGWTGGNTSLQALFLGKPILTIEGQYMRGRHTSAMLNLLNLSTFKIAESKEDLYQIAENLSKDNSKLEEIYSEILEKKSILFSDHQTIAAIDKFIKEHIK